MESARLHLYVDHLPITGVIIGLLVLIAGLLFKRAEVRITALGIFIFSALVSLLALYTGENAEQAVKEDGNYSETLIHLHEEYSRIFLILLIVLGILSIITYIVHLKKSRFTLYLYLSVCALAIGSIYTGYIVSASGRQIHHPEIRNTNSVIDIKQRDK